MKNLLIAIITLSIYSCESDNISYVKENTNLETSKSVYLNEFKKTIVGKSMKEIKSKYGPPCDAQDLNGMKLWYYGEKVCGNDNSSRIKIINEDTEKEVTLIQIQFNSRTAVAVNIY